MTLIRTGIRRKPDSVLGQFVVKPAKCKVCKSLILPPSRPTAIVCSGECAASLALSERLKAEKRQAVKAAKLAAADRRDTRAKLDKLKSRATLAAEAQVFVNKYVRLRDAHLGCVSCDKPASWDGQWHASHFRSVGAASGLRFNLWNIHKACSICNHHLSGNIAAYEPRLIERIGAGKVDWLRTQNAVKRTDAAYLERLKAVFSSKVRRLEKRMKAHT